MSVIWAPSPYGGPAYNRPKKIIVHCMGEFIGQHHAVKFLETEALSAHSIICPDGTNYRLRQDGETAWHAKGHNIDSLGIEFLVPGEFNNYPTFINAIKFDYLPEAAYQAGLAQIIAWLQHYPIEVVARHSDVDPARKVDPGEGFPWQRLLNDIRGYYDG